MCPTIESVIFGISGNSVRGHTQANSASPKLRHGTCLCFTSLTLPGAIHHRNPLFGCRPETSTSANTTPKMLSRRSCGTGWNNPMTPDDPTSRKLTQSAGSSERSILPIRQIRLSSPLALSTRARSLPEPSHHVCPTADILFQDDEVALFCIFQEF